MDHPAHTPQRSVPGTVLQKFHGRGTLLSSPACCTGSGSGQFPVADQKPAAPPLLSGCRSNCNRRHRRTALFAAMYPEKLPFAASADVSAEQSTPNLGLYMKMYTFTSPYVRDVFFILIIWYTLSDPFRIPTSPQKGK